MIQELLGGQDNIRLKGTFSEVKMTHTLKLTKRYFSEVLGRNKNFELRKNDRDFHKELKNDEE